MSSDLPLPSLSSPAATSNAPAERIIVGVDPGYRNLALARIVVSCDNIRVSLTTRHLDIGPCRRDEDVAVGLASVLKQNEDLFIGADLVVIEQQNLGPRNTKTRNIIAATAATVIAVNASPKAHVIYADSRSKFTKFKGTVALPNVLKNRDPKRRQKGKANSVFLAQHLMTVHGIDVNTHFPPNRRSQFEHVADAIGLAFANVGS